MFLFLLVIYTDYVLIILSKDFKEYAKPAWILLAFTSKKMDWSPNSHAQYSSSLSLFTKLIFSFPEVMSSLMIYLSVYFSSFLPSYFHINVELYSDYNDALKPLVIWKTHKSLLTLQRTQIFFWTSCLSTAFQFCIIAMHDSLSFLQVLLPSISKGTLPFRPI